MSQRAELRSHGRVPSPRDVASRGVAALLLLLLTTACGGGGGDAAKPPPPKPADEKPKEEGPDPLDENYVILGENPRWKPIATLFEAYAKRDVAGITSPALNNITLYVKKPEILPPLPGTGAPGTPPGATPGPGTEPVATTCATKNPLDRYQLVILMTGKAQPKAVVVDQTGERCELVRGDTIGSEGGTVEAILQYEMIVAVPGKEKKVRMSIKPPIVTADEEEGEDGEVP